MNNQEKLFIVKNAGMLRAIFGAKAPLLKALGTGSALGGGAYAYNKHGDPRRPFPEYGAMNSVNRGDPGYSGFGADWPTWLGGFEEEDKAYDQDGNVLPYLKRFYDGKDTSTMSERDARPLNGPRERVPQRDSIKYRDGSYENMGNVER